MRDIHAIGGWLSEEVRAIASFAREPQLWAALACGLILWTLAYQVPYSFRLHIGGDQATLRQHDDDPFLDGFWDSEPSDLWKRPDAVPFRWTQEDATIVLPGIGGGSWNTAIKAAGRPDRVPAASRWDDGSSVTTVTIDPLPLVYRFAARADSAGDLTLHFATPPFKPAEDPRALGFVMLQVDVESAGWARLPAARQLALLAASLALSYALCRRLAFAPRATLALALGLAALATGLLLRQRMALTLLTPRLAIILAAAYLVGVLLDQLYRTLLVRDSEAVEPAPAHTRWKPAFSESAVSSFVAFTPTGRLEAPPAFAPARPRSRFIQRPSFVVGLIVLAAVLRLGGMLHPQARFSDVGLNTNNLIGFTQGEVYFTEGLPAEAGGGRAPYPPGQYVTMAPAMLVVPTERAALGMILKIGNAVWDSLVVGLLWYVLRRGGYRERAALVGAALYLLPPPMLKSLSIGELANVFGQALALPLLALLAIRARRLHPPPVFAGVVLLLGLALFGHLGVTISLFCLLGYLGLVWLIRLETRRAVQALMVAGLLAGGLVAAFYYSAFLDVLARRLRGTPDAGAEAALSVAEKLGNQLNALPAYGIQPLAIALGAIGVVLVALRPRLWRHPGPRPALGSLLIAWWGGTLLSLGLLIFASQGVRWQQFLYPALCVGAAPTLAALWPRGRAGRLVAATLLAFLLWHGLDFWVGQIRDYLH
jgi:hypothetical protein